MLIFDQKDTERMYYRQYGSLENMTLWAMKKELRMGQRMALKRAGKAVRMVEQKVLKTVAKAERMVSM
jgi:hypothetical protein